MNPFRLQNYYFTSSTWSPSSASSTSSRARPILILVLRSGRRRDTLQSAGPVSGPSRRPRAEGAATETREASAEPWQGHTASLSRQNRARHKGPPSWRPASAAVWPQYRGKMNVPTGGRTGPVTARMWAAYLRYTVGHSRPTRTRTPATWTLSRRHLGNEMVAMRPVWFGLYPVVRVYI